MKVEVPLLLLVTLVMFGTLGIGVLAVLYGTLAKKRWGINSEPISCPRCKTPPPKVRRPMFLRQGGWTCAVCGADVDKWGRLLASVGPTRHGHVQSGDGTQATLRRRLLFAAPFCFCAMMLLDWTGITDGGFPSTWGEGLFQVGANLLWTVFFMVIFYLGLGHLLRRFSPAKGERKPARGRDSSRQQGV
jgi:hypothetical protein